MNRPGGAFVGSSGSRNKGVRYRRSVTGPAIRLSDKKTDYYVRLNRRTVKLGPFLKEKCGRVDWLPANGPRSTSMANTGFARMFRLPGVHRQTRHGKYYPPHASVRTRMCRARKVNTVRVDCVCIRPRFNASTFAHNALLLFLAYKPILLRFFRFRRFGNIAG